MLYNITKSTSISKTKKLDCPKDQLYHQWHENITYSSNLSLSYGENKFLSQFMLTYSDLLCVLTTNMWNRKFYTFLHFWFVSFHEIVRLLSPSNSFLYISFSTPRFVLLLVITIGGAFYRLCTILVPTVRQKHNHKCWVESNIKNVNM